MTLRWNNGYKTKKVKIVSMMSTKHTGVLKESGKIHHAAKEPWAAWTISVVSWYRMLWLEKEWSGTGKVFIDFDIYNAFIVWKKLTQSKKTNYQFREQLVDAIYMFHFNGRGSSCPGPTATPTEMKDLLRLKEKHYFNRRNFSETNFSVY